MSQAFEAVKVTDSVYWVGALDWSMRDFHGYLTSRGTTYNAYLILAEKITLIDTVKAPFVDEMLARIAAVVDPSDMSYIISNHAEMDHSSGLPAAIEAVQPETVFASQKGVEALGEHYHLDRDIEAVKNGGSQSLGDMGLSFVETRMLHWPDSMFSYLDEGGVLFSQDAFGMHLATSERFADEIADDVLEYEAAKYYGNILLPLSALVTKLLQQVPDLGLDIKIIAPDHGPIWRQNIDRILQLYGHWAQQQPTRKAVVVYDTMWQSTARMARAIGEGLQAGGATPRLMQLRASHRSEVATEILDAGALLVGSPTMNSNLFPTVADVLTYLKGLKPRNLVGAAFGSYGWSGEAVGQIEEMLTEMRVDLVAEGLRVKYVPDDQALRECYELGRQVGQRLHQMCSSAQ